MEHLTRALYTLDKDFNKTDEQKYVELFNEVVQFSKDNNKDFRLENIEKHIDEYLKYKFDNEKEKEKENINKQE